MKKTNTRSRPKIPFTKKGYQEVLEQKKELLAERPDAVKNLRKAREMGDLSENGYYKASRAKLSSIDAKLRRIERLVRFGVIVNSLNTGRVNIGSSVILSNGEKEFKYTIVGGYESNPTKGTISHRSPIGRALMGKSEQETAIVHAPAGDITFTILKINPAKSS